jgi:peroxiredoxin
MMKSTILGMVTSAFMLSMTGGLHAVDIGEPAPGFTGTDINGNTHSLSDFKGQVVVLEAYNMDCPFCAKHFNSGAMQELQKELTDKGVVWLLINSVNADHSSYRTPEAARAEWDKLKIEATAWIDDKSGEIGRAYNLRTTPHMIVIDQEGVLVYDGAIDDQPAAKGDPREARNYVKEAVEAVLAGEPVPTGQTQPYGCGIKYAK